ncbi:hypothetical protein EIP86_002830 [Pleurotus ostreatoroseus]|nr:hypothetical protein EIP86_002830 [Pleurotus ostreatoroseus]
MLSFEPGQGSHDMYDGVPRVDLTDEAEDLNSLLGAMYNVATLPLRRFDPDKPRLLMGTMRLAIKYEVDGIRDVIMRSVEEDWPHDAESYGVWLAERTRAIQLHQDWWHYVPEPAAAMQFATTFDCDKILAGVLYHMATLSTSATLPATAERQPHFVRWQLLDSINFFRYVTAQELLKNETNKCGPTLWPRTQVAGCQCHISLTQIDNIHRTIIANDIMQPMMLILDTIRRTNVCAICLRAIAQNAIAFRALQTQIWGKVTSCAREAPVPWPVLVDVPWETNVGGAPTKMCVTPSLVSNHHLRSSNDCFVVTVARGHLFMSETPDTPLRGLKRKRLASWTNEPELVRHKTLYIEDGDIVLTAPCTDGHKRLVFRIDKIFLARHSPIFKDMLAFAPGQGSEDAYEGVPRADLPDNAEDLAVLLSIMYNELSEPWIRFDPDIPLRMKGVVRLAVKYEAEAIRKAIIRDVQDNWPDSLEAYDVWSMKKEFVHSRREDFWDFVPEPASAMQFATEFGCTQMATAVMYHLARSRADVTLPPDNYLPEVKPHRVRWNLLDAKNLYRVLRAQLKFRDYLPTFRDLLLCESEHCADEEICGGHMKSVLDAELHEGCDVLGLCATVLDRFGAVGYHSEIDYRRIRKAHAAIQQAAKSERPPPRPSKRAPTTIRYSPRSSSSKLSVSSVRGSIRELLSNSKEKQRNFVETIELQIGLKNYDPQRDKRFSGTVKLPNVPRPRMSICILADAADIDRAKQIDLEYMSVDDLKKLNKNKKLVKKLAKKYDAFLSSETLIKQIPRLLGPGLSKAGKFPTPVAHAEDLAGKILEVRSTIKFQLKKVLCLGVAVGHVQMTEDQVLTNVMLSINFLVSLLKKNWQNVKSLHIKSTMGKPIRLF